MTYTLRLLKRNKENLEEKIREHTMLLNSLLSDQNKTQVIKELAQNEKHLEELKYAIEILEYDFETTV